MKLATIALHMPRKNADFCTNFGSLGPLLPSFSPHQTKACMMTIHPEELDSFFALLERPAIQQLLLKDGCYNMADSFLLSTAFIYFKRAGLREEEYTERSFWLALYLAHDQEEDEDRSK